MTTEHSTRPSIHVLAQTNSVAGFRRESWTGYRSRTDALEAKRSEQLRYDTIVAWSIDCLPILGPLQSETVEQPEDARIAIYEDAFDAYQEARRQAVSRVDAFFDWLSSAELVDAMPAGDPCTVIDPDYEAFHLEANELFFARMANEEARQKPTCKHPNPYAWFAYDDTLCLACTVCGEVLKGGVTL